MGSLQGGVDSLADSGPEGSTDVTGLGPVFDDVSVMKTEKSD